MNTLHPIFQQALAPFVRPALIDDGPDLDGLFFYEHITSAGLVLRCYMTYEPAMHATDVQPGHSESMEIDYVFAGIIDILEVLDRDVMDEIKQGAMSAMKDEQHADAFDHTAD